MSKEDTAQSFRIKTLRLGLKILIAASVLCIVCAVSVLAAASYFDAPPNTQPNLELSSGFQSASIPVDDMRYDGSGMLLLEVRNGESAQSVGRRLEHAGIIRSARFWNILARLSRDHIKAGTYQISLPASQSALRKLLVSGDQVLVRVTIPEGATLRRTAQILEDAGITSADAFILAASSQELLSVFNISSETMEGYLFPDTYLFPFSYPAARVVSAMAENFFRRLARIAPHSLSMSSKEINERVIMASIVEREYRVADEAEVMAGVFFNRLQIGMMLQSCATIVYVMTEIQGRPHPERIFFRDLAIDNPYNSYRNFGLPPGAISNPGETALKAAFFPAETGYLYFRLVNASDGRHYFSRTLGEHDRAGFLFVKGR